MGTGPFGSAPLLQPRVDFRYEAGGEFGQGGAIAVITAILLMSISIYYVRQVTKEEEL